MSLKRYNEILFALLGSGTVLAVLIALLGHPFGFRSPPARLQTPTSNPTTAQQTLPSAPALCLPLLAARTDYQYFPVASSRMAADADTAAPAGTLDFTQLCHFPAGSSNRVFNVIVRNSATNEQRLVLNRPGQVLDVTLPDPDCASGTGPVPCGTVFWLIRDGDAAVLYASDLAARELYRLSPQGASVLDWVWNSRSGEALIQVRRRGSEADIVSARVMPPAEGTPVIEVPILQQLHREGD
jgi:hypothetical protein